jgi:UDP-N-acetylglucosamine 4-epimerase
VDYVLHQAALGSVPRSVADPITTNAANVTGFLNMLVAARDANVTRLYAATAQLTETIWFAQKRKLLAIPFSYAVTKYVNELYADVFGKLMACNVSDCATLMSSVLEDPNGAMRQ